MIPALSSTRLVRVLALAVPCLVPALGGCNSDSYPASMAYPPRTDLIVVAAPTAESFYTHGPGQLDATIAATAAHGGKTLNPHDLPPADRQELTGALAKAFGTPAAPRVLSTDDETKKQVADLKLDDETLRQGSVHYRRHCMHCHGVPGDGRGPTGPWVSPHPRDYRQGLFKFLSTDTTVGQRKPRRQDLHRTLEKGIEGTSMPSFNLLEETQLEELVSYVIHLSIRGEVELTTISTLLSVGRANLETGSIDEEVQKELGVKVLFWHESNGKVLEPGSYPYRGDEQVAASIRRGYDQFIDPQGAASCIKCHLDYGRQVPFRYDKWGTLVRPANLTAGVYRGGRRPIDLYWRIRGGIPGTDMSAANIEAGRDRSVDPYWDIVNFVRALPYPHMLPEDIRNKIYPPPGEAPPAHAQR